MRAVAVTTIDNPYDPIDDFKHWFQFDVTHGYNTCGYLDRVSNTSDALSDDENDQEVEQAIDDIIKYDALGLYKKVVKEIEDDRYPEAVVS